MRCIVGTYLQKLLDEVFAISRMIKVDIGVKSRG